VICPRFDKALFGALLLAFLLPFAGHADSFDPAPIIRDLDLRSADTPMSEHPGWKPEKVIVQILPADKALIEDYKATLRKVAGDVELIFPTKGRKLISKEGLDGVDGVIGMCTPTLLQAASPSLRWVHNYSVGMDLCQGASDEQLENIVFTNNKRLSGPTIAEHSIAMLLSLTRGLPAYQKSQGSTRWAPRRRSNVAFGELSGKTILVVGLGGIGTEVARRAHGLGMRVIATRNSSREGPDFVEHVGLANELHTLAGQADVIVNTLPLTDKTTGIFDAGFFDRGKKGAIFISVGRGKSTVTSDLVAALESGQLYAAGLDVTDPEPLPKDSPLWAMENVIITPHVAASGAGSRRRSLVIAAENLRRYVSGEPMLSVVDIGKGY
jgi:phosphoglycerate dehydrogenase-like enzyme